MNNPMKIRVIKFSNLINRNTGFLIVLTMVVFGLAIIGFQRDNQRILRDTRNTVDNTEKLLMGQKENAEQRDRAVQDLIDDNKRQTELIICLLAIHGESTAVTQADEESCRQRIATAQEAGRTNQTPVPTPQPQVKPEKPEEIPPKPENPGILERLQNAAQRALDVLRGDR